MTKRAAAFLILAVTVWVGWGVGAADAGPPEKLWTFAVDEQNVLVDCDGFQVIDHVTGVMTVTAWYGKDGQPSRIVMENSGQHQLRNSATSVAVTSKYHRRFMTDVEAGQTHVVGPAYHVTVPGHGAVLFDTGSIKFESGGLTRMSGQQQTMSGQLHRLCPAFA